VSERHVYEYDVDTTSDTAPARVCRMVGSGKRVLEIGAGPGSITKVLTAAKNSVVALELDETAIPFLTQHCEKVVAANLDQPGWPATFGEDRFDAIVAADVLEHLTDPWSTLGRMRSLLAPGGALVLSIPHAAHAGILACLLHEDLEYRDWGLLDRTHIRFFGLRNLQALVDKADMKIVRAEFVCRSPLETELREKWEALDAEARTFLGKQPFAQVYQVVMMVADKSDRRPAVRLLDLDPANFGAKPLENWLSKRIPGVAKDALRAASNKLRR
jgi:2-polyprenyl-3-methyl-5-hydroxy-6-metoxy-1,4-benzoquinol methylase